MAKRLFFGVKIKASPALLSVYEEIKLNMFNDKVKWVEPSNMHLTITFLGSTEEKLIPSLKKTLEELSVKFNSFDLTLKSFGLFKNIHNPTVVWIGVEKIQIFSEIKKALDKELENFGIETETREFNPHLTLGRPKFINDKKVLSNLIEKLKNKTFDQQKITEIILFESIPGPVYKSIYSSKLNC